MREIVLDTETTGLSPEQGDRVVEIGCIELVNHMPTGETYHTYVNPQRDMPVGAFNVHGLSEEFLSTKPLFADVAGAFLDFIGDAVLVAHNASFDMGFLNMELERVKKPVIPYHRVVDTLAIAKKKYPGAQNNLDALCRRFEVDNSDRELHGALLDSELLAEVYLELIGGRQPGLTLAVNRRSAESLQADRVKRPPRPHAPSAEERAAHEAFLR
ncbi:MAG: DNA polymerase III subunit epsilon, partial [Proteobacteria bacterium]|nr:DNA polymerase III subunit epsilon [Pseudomonadota bacterium]